MIKNKKTIKIVIAVATALLIAYLMRLIHFAPEKTLLMSLVMMVRYMIHVSLLIGWCISLHHRLINTQVRWLMIFVGGFLAFGLTARTVTYELVGDTIDPILRYLSYSYYIPMLLVPLLSIFVVYFIGKLEGQKLPKKRYLTLIPAGLCGVYSALYLHGDLMVIECIMIVALLESAIQSGMISSNANYSEILRRMTVPVIIVDEEYHPHFVSGSAMPIPEEIMRDTEKGAVNLGDTLLDSAPITGGRVVWQRDISGLNALCKELDLVYEQLSRENTLLQEEIERKEKKARADEKNRLYGRIAVEVSSQLAAIDSLIQTVKKTPEHSKMLMAKVSVMGAYIKRRGNLVLLGEDTPLIPSRELEYCLRESTDNLKLCHVYTSLNSKHSGQLSFEKAILVYDFFETVIEKLLDQLSAVLVHLSCLDGTVKMRMQLGCTDTIEETVFRDIALSKGTYTYEIQEEDVVVDFSFSEGGEGNDTV